MSSQTILISTPTTNSASSFLAPYSPLHKSLSSPFASPEKRFPVTLNGVEHSIDMLSDHVPYKSSTSTTTSSSSSSFNKDSLDRETAETDTEKSPQNDMASPNNSDDHFDLTTSLKDTCDDEKNIHSMASANGVSAVVHTQKYNDIPMDRSDGTDSDGSFPDGVEVIMMDRVLPHQPPQPSQSPSSSSRNSSQDTTNKISFSLPKSNNNSESSSVALNNSSMNSLRSSTSSSVNNNNNAQYPMVPIADAVKVASNSTTTAPIATKLITTTAAALSSTTTSIDSEHLQNKPSMATAIPIIVICGLKNSSTALIEFVVQRQHGFKVGVISRAFTQSASHKNGSVSVPLVANVGNSFQQLTDLCNSNNGGVDAVVLDVSGMAMNFGSLLNTLKTNDAISSFYSTASIVCLLEVKREDFASYQRIEEMLAVADLFVIVTSTPTSNSNSNRSPSSSSSSSSSTTANTEISSKFLDQLESQASSLNPFLRISRAYRQQQQQQQHSFNQEYFPLEEILTHDAFDYEKLSSLDFSYFDWSKKFTTTVTATVQTIGVTIHGGGLSPLQFQSTIHQYLQQQGDNIFKFFGVLAFDNSSSDNNNNNKSTTNGFKFTFIGIRKLVTFVRTQSPLLPNEPLCSKLVFVCRSNSINTQQLVEALRQCSVSPHTEIEITH